MPVKGADIVSKNIIAFGGGFLKQVNQDMEQVRDVLDKAVDKNISLTDHSLKDLALLGHPYASRAPQRVHSPGYQVHIQSGRLKRGKYSGTHKASILGGQLTARAYVGIADSVEHALFVVYGTSKMIPRDFLIGSLGEVREKIWDILSRSLKNAVVSFQGERRVI
jgi:hypothetical protein